MPAPQYAPQGWIGRALAGVSKVFDGNVSDVKGTRTGRYQEPFMLSPVPPEHLLADEGSLMIAGMLPGATTLQLGVSATFGSGFACIVFQNTDAAGPAGKRCHLRHIRFVVSTAPASGTNLLYATVLDPISRVPLAANISLLGSPTTLTAYKAPAFCTNMDEQPQIVGQPYFPQSTSASATAVPIPVQSQQARTIIGNGILRGQIPIVLDDYRIAFGQTDAPAGQLLTAAPAGAGRIVEPHPAVTVGPQECFVFHLWSTSNAAAGIAFQGLEIAWFER